MSSPTLAFYSSLQAAFDHFNVHLFGGELPACLITLRSASRVYGYHHAKRFVSADGLHLDELGLHPGFFTLRSIEAVLSTLVHEMAHHWQHHFGTPTNSNPHNKEWARKMELLGLVPSHTGLPEGKKTGRSVSHYIQPEGAYLKACRELLATGFALPWMDRHAPAPPEREVAHQAALQAAGIVIDTTPPPSATLPQQINGKTVIVGPPPKRPNTRERFTCPDCGAKAWAAPGTQINCGICSVAMLDGRKDATEATASVSTM
jgi:hypothetical protein